MKIAAGPEMAALPQSAHLLEPLARWATEHRLV